MGILLDERLLRKYIEQDLATILEGVTVEDARSKIISDEKKCISILVQTIHDGQLEIIKEKTTAKAMFNALINIFERKSIAR